jgi:hypothetical protein
MGIVDEEGRLFGVVNIIDLVVVVVVLATLASGAVFVLADNPESPADRYLTVVLDDRPSGSVPVLDADAAPMPDGSVELGRTDGQVTDTYVAPIADGGFVTVARIRVPVSAAVANETTARRLVTDGDSYLVGQEVGLTAGEADYTGYVHAIGRSGPNLPVRTVNATVDTRLPTPVADRIQPGDTQRVAGRDIARVVAVDREPTTGNRTRVEATVELQVFQTDDGPFYGTQHVRPGTELTIASDGYEFTGTVTEVA